MKTIGVIADTHGLLRQEAIQLLEGSDLILHAGDIGKLEVIVGLEQIAPVVAVRGNVDKEPWADGFEAVEAIEVEGRYLYLIHNIQELDVDPSGHFDAVVFGHSHKPVNEVKDGVLYFNPASAGPRRFKLPIAIGKIRLSDSHISAEIIEIDI